MMTHHNKKKPGLVHTLDWYMLRIYQSKLIWGEPERAQHRLFSSMNSAGKDGEERHLGEVVGV